MKGAPVWGRFFYSKTNREWTEALEYTKDRDGNPCPVNNVGNLVTITSAYRKYELCTEVTVPVK